MTPEDVTKDELMHELRVMHDEIRHLQSIKEELKWVEEALRKRTADLSERLKELGCLYRTIGLFRQHELSWPEKLQGTVDMLPAAFRSPKLVCAHIHISGVDVTTTGFKETTNALKREIRVNHRKVGHVDVFTRQPATNEENSFLKEESDLMDVLAEFLGLAVECNPSESG